MEMTGSKTSRCTCMWIHGCIDGRQQNSIRVAALLGRVTGPRAHEGEGAANELKRERASRPKLCVTHADETLSSPLSRQHEAAEIIGGFTNLLRRPLKGAALCER